MPNDHDYENVTNGASLWLLIGICKLRSWVPITTALAGIIFTA
jgi:hypothetical protein